MHKRLLIVDDEKTLCESLKRMLSKEGYDVDCVHCSDAAIASLTEKPYDLVISDIIMPGSGGIELMRKCRQKNPDLIFILITAYASIESAVASIKTGAHEYLIKPIDHNELKAVIKRCLSENRSVHAV